MWGGHRAAGGTLSQGIGLWTLLFVLGCSVYDPSLIDSSGAGVPDRPPQNTSSADDSASLVFALKDIFLRQSAEMATRIGVDLDPRAKLKHLSIGQRQMVEICKAILRDARGQVRVKLTVLPDGAPALAMLDGGGQPRAVLCLEDDGSPRLDLIDSLGNLRVTLTMLEDGISALSLLDSEGNSRAGLTVTHEGSPRLNLRDKNAKVRATLREIGRASCRERV